MVATYPGIAAVRASCNACAYPPCAPSSSRPTPPSARFSVAAEAAYDTAVTAFNAATLTRCNAEQAASITALNAGAAATKTICDTANLLFTPGGATYCQSEQANTRELGAADAAEVHVACLAGPPTSWSLPLQLCASPPPATCVPYPPPPPSPPPPDPPSAVRPLSNTFPTPYSYCLAHLVPIPSVGTKARFIPKTGYEIVVS